MADNENRTGDDRRIYDRREDPRVGLGFPERRKKNRRVEPDRRKSPDK